MALTQKQGNNGPGCAFGCHESNAAKYDISTPKSPGIVNPGGVDNYTLAKNNNIQLRIDVVNSSVQKMISVAKSQTTATVNYRMGSYTFDYFFNQLAPDPNTSSAPVTSDLKQVQDLTKNLQTVTVYKPNWITPTINDDEADTDFDTAMSSMNKIMYTPGNGTNLPGDTPQGVLFIVSDAVIDEQTGAVGSRLITAVDANKTWCSTVKNRGIRIAFLYTTYIPLPTDSYYMTHINGMQSQLGPKYAKNCASPGLYTEVNSNGDIATAMQNLFNAATKTAHLTQ